MAARASPPQVAIASSTCASSVAAGSGSAGIETAGSLMGTNSEHQKGKSQAPPKTSDKITTPLDLFPSHLLKIKRRLLKLVLSNYAL